MMANNSDGTDRQLPAKAAAQIGYFARTSRPVYAIVFLLPFIVLYEVLVLLVNPQLLTTPVSNIRGAVVSFVWVQNFLCWLGMSTKNAWFFAPVVVILVLLLIQFISRQSWELKPADFLIMTVECLVLALPLIVLALVLNRSAGAAANAASFQADSPTRTIAMDLLTGIGAGIYEELIFRLILISLSMVFFETILGVQKFKAIIISVIISSVLFSLHHHFVFLNGQFARAETFTLARFAFRTVAGVFFAVIFAARGFGIVAGTHSFYDCIATLLNAALFGQS
jgi:hypothetical protein